MVKDKNAFRKWLARTTGGKFFSSIFFCFFCCCTYIPPIQASHYRGYTLTSTTFLAACISSRTDFSCELPIHLISPIGHEGCLSGLLVLSHRARFAGHYHRFPISTRFCTLQLSRRIGFLRGPSARIERAAAHSTDPWLVCLTSLSVRSGVSRLVSLSRNRIFFVSFHN